MFIYRPDENFAPEKHFKEVPLCQGMFFKRWQERHGRRIASLAAGDTEGKVKAYIQCVEYTLPIVGSVWVAAHGPVGSFDSVSGERMFYKELRSLCVEIAPKTAHIRIQKAPDTQAVRVVTSELTSGSFMQPFAERVIPLEHDFNEVVADFTGNTRRLARRYEEGKFEEVQFRTEKKNFMPHLKGVYALLKDSAASRGFALHPYAYYESLFQELDTHPECGVLLLGYVKGNEQPATFILAVYTGSGAFQVIAGTSALGCNYNMPTLAHYAMLKEMKEAGIQYYNFGGVAYGASDELGNLSTFKKKFGGKKVEYGRLHDIVVSGWRYYLFRFLRLQGIIKLRRLMVRFYRAAELELNAED